MAEENCPLCGRKALRYRKRTKDYSCKECPFEGASELIDRMGSKEDREWAFHQLLHSIPEDQRDTQTLVALGHLSDLPLDEMDAAFEEFQRERTARGPSAATGDEGSETARPGRDSHAEGSESTRPSSRTGRGWMVAVVAAIAAGAVAYALTK